MAASKVTGCPYDRLRADTACPFCDSSSGCVEPLGNVRGYVKCKECGGQGPANDQKRRVAVVEPTILPVVRIERSAWRPMENAPKDRQILARRHNDVMHEFYVVWWSDDREYPWQADHTAYPEGRLDEWCEIPV